jgi:hypothetical protein
MPSIQERARVLQLPLKVVEMASFDIADDISYYVKRKNVDLVLLGWNERLFGSGGTKVRSVLTHIDASVGVLVDRGLEDYLGVKNVLMLYTGAEYQRDALKLVRRMSRHEECKVTIVSNLPEESIPHGTDCHYRYMYSDDPLPAAIEESKNAYNLLVVGIGRYSDDDAFLETSHLINLTGVSILLLHARDVARKVQNEKTRLFLNKDDAAEGKPSPPDEEGLELKENKLHNDSVILEVKPKSEDGSDDGAATPITTLANNDEYARDSTSSSSDDDRDVVEVTEDIHNMAE